MLRGLLGGFARGRRQTSAATLVLDFLAGLNDSRITYSGGANGTRVNSSGNIVAATTPRFDYDPVTLAAKGLLVEEARTNLITYSSDFTNAAWLKSSAAVAVTGDATTSPDGTVNADKIYEADTTTTNRDVLQPFITITPSGTYTGSVYVKQSERTTCQVRITSGNGTFSTYFANINLATGAITGSGTAGGMVSGSASIQPAANGFYRVIITGVFAADVTLGGVDVYCYNGSTTNYAGVVNSGFFVWGAQFEAGAFATSYIPTTTASVTRTADSAVMTGTNFSSWYNQSEGTFVVAGDLVFPANGGNQFFVRASDNSYSNSVQIGSGSTGFCSLVTASGGVFDGVASVGNAFTANSVFKTAGSYKTNALAVCVNAGTVATDSSATIPSALTRLDLGADHAGANHIGSGHLRSIAYYPTARPNSLQALTA